MEQELITVNNNDEETGTISKSEAHRLGILHRAFSVLIFDTEGKMLLQKRADQKYHSGGCGQMHAAVIHVRTKQR